MSKWFEKQKYLIDFTLSCLLRQKGRNAALILVFTFLVFLLGSTMFFARSMRHEALAVLSESPRLIVQRTIAGRHDLLPASCIEQIRKINGVKSVRGRLWGYYYDWVSKADFTLMAARDLRLEDETITVGKGIAEIQRLDEGDMLAFRSHDGESLIFQVKEILPPETELLSSDLVLMGENDFRRLFGISDRYFTDLIVEADSAAEAAVEENILQLLPETRVISRNDILKTYDAAWGWRGGLFAVVFPGAVMAFLILVLDKAMGLNAEEQREIGALKSIGWRTSDVLLMKSWEGCAISATSFFIGILMAYVHVFMASAKLFQPFLKGWSMLYPDFTLTPFISPFQITALFLFVSIPYTAAVVVPSWKAARANQG